MLLNPLEGLDFNEESRSACRDNPFLRMLKGLELTPSPLEAESESLANFTMSVCSRMCSWNQIRN